MELSKLVTIEPLVENTFLLWLYPLDKLVAHEKYILSTLVKL